MALSSVGIRVENRTSESMWQGIVCFLTRAQNLFLVALVRNESVAHVFDAGKQDIFTVLAAGCSGTTDMAISCAGVTLPRNASVIDGETSTIGHVLFWTFC